MIRRFLTFFSVCLGFFISFVDKAMSRFFLQMRDWAYRKAWLLLLIGSVGVVARRGRELASKGIVFFFRGPLLVQLQA